MTEQNTERFVAALDATQVEPDPEFVTRLRQDVRREAASSADSPIIQIHDLGEPVMTKLDTQQPENSGTGPPRKWWSSRLAAGLAAAGVLVVVGLAVGINALQDDDGVTPADGAQTFGTESALETAEAFFDSYNAGDESGVLALFASGITISDSFGGSWELDDWAPLLAWDAAQGFVFVLPTCVADPPTDGSSIVVRCQSTSEGALPRAVGLPGVDTTVVVVATPDGIADLRFVYGSPDFLFVGDPFASWMARQNPDSASSVGFGVWSSIEEARQNGLLIAEFAQEWADYLDANNCTFLDDC